MGYLSFVSILPAKIERRRFPPPWSVEETSVCFVVRDHNGQAQVYVYFEDEPRRRSAAKLLTRDAPKVPALWAISTAISLITPPVEK
jgi:hypothetical protein